MGTSAANVIREANAAYLSLVNGEGDRISQFFSADYTVHLTERKMTGGRKLVRTAAAKYASAFSGLKLEVESLAEQPDRVAWLRVFRGTLTGAFYGFPASGREIVWRDMVTSRLADGLIVEEWVVSDLAERLLVSRKQP